jgi:O-acetyl-ADP-ribose deacetylase
VWMGGKLNEDALLASCYRASLRLAAQHGVRTLAFPAISCGIFGYPLNRACGIAVHTVHEALKMLPTLEQVVLAVIDRPIERALRNAIRQPA